MHEGMPVYSPEAAAGAQDKVKDNSEINLSSSFQLVLVGLSFNSYLRFGLMLLPVSSVGSCPFLIQFFLGWKCPFSQLTAGMIHLVFLEGTL